MSTYVGILTPARMRASSLAIFLTLVSLSACSDASSPATTVTLEETSTTGVEASVSTTAVTTPTTSSTVASLDVPDQLEGLDVARVSLDDRELLVAIAATGDERRQGLMNIVSLGDLEGMLFVFDADTAGGFWMKDTLLPLDISFFAADGTFIDGFAMEPCTTTDCPTYRPSGAYRYALEMLQGSMPEQIDTLDISTLPAP